MKKRLTAVFCAFVLALSLAGTSLAAGSAKDICVLYTNDVHCAVDDHIGYAGLAAYKKDMVSSYGAGNVTLVDAGDAVQGAAIGALSKGESPVAIMNEVGYDVFTPGNHEFDYGLDQMFKLMTELKAAVVSCNFEDAQGKTVFKPYTIIDCGGVKIAYVGITTPKTFTSAAPTYFQDRKGGYIYGFCEDQTGEKLYAAVQSAVDSAVRDGAAYVVAVGHCGVGEEYAPWQSTDIIAHTTGISVFIDGHSHSVIPGEIHKDKAGKDVILTSTGTQLASIGKLIITPGGAMTTQLVSDYTKKDADTDAFVKSLQAKDDALLGTVVAKTAVPLVVNDPETGKRLIRNSETNLGDLCADAYRDLLGADVAVVNGGGIRADIKAGDITYKDIIAVHPFGNYADLIEATGQQILDLLEMMSRQAPNENGGFEQVSGLTYEIYTNIKSSVVLDDKGNFVKVAGEYRVKNVMVAGQPLDLAKTYKLASHNYLIKNGGDGYGGFIGDKILRDDVMIDNEVLIGYITGKLGGAVGSQYADIHGAGRIYIMPFTDLRHGGWYESAALQAYKDGLISGTSASSFSPDGGLTRAMFTAMLYREAGSPAVDQKPSALFSDCPDGSWYGDAAVWAAEKGLVQGSGGAFRPDDTLSRQEMAVILYQYLQTAASSGAAAAPAYSDASGIAGWASGAVAYCSEKGLLTGSYGAFSPDSPATRAMGAVVLARLAALGKSAA